MVVGDAAVGSSLVIFKSERGVVKPFCSLLLEKGT